MLKISKIARHAVVQATACAKVPKGWTCPDISARHG